jgi:hypothetical protein
MRSRFLLKGALLFVAFHCLPANADCQGSGPQFVSRYNGTVGSFRVRMALKLDSGSVTGLYFYASQLKDINLRGTIINGSKVVLDEMDAANKIVARFAGSFQTSDPEHHFNGPLQCEVITGIWHKTDSKEELPFYLAWSDLIGADLSHQYMDTGALDDEVINRSAQQFWNAVKRGDRKTVAAAMEYPIAVGGGTKCKATIHNEHELLKNYDRLILPLRDAIVSDIPRDMWVHSGLVMLAGGNVWFGADGKVAVLNIVCPNRNAGG